MALLIPQLQSIDALHKYFQLPRARVVSVIDFLMELKLVQLNGQRLQVIKPVLHLEKQSPLNIQHHTQWRIRATEILQASSDENLQYSGVICLSQNDYHWVHAKISRFLEEVIKKVKTSDNEQLACLNIDWFKI